MFTLFLLVKAGVWGRQLPSRPKDATAPGRAHGTGTVYKCAVVPTDLPLLPGVQHLFCQLPRSRQEGNFDQKFLDRLAVRVDGGREHTL